ncbi:MAG: hypothetical protein Q8Q23_01210 [bacterium]|nr:hypothetical protein [bacterium]
MNKKYIIVLIIILVLLGLGGWYLYSKNQPVVDNGAETGGDNVVVENRDREVKELDLGELELDTSDWLTYRNEEYGFEVKYPGGIQPSIYEHSHRPSITFKQGDENNSDALYFDVRVSKPYSLEEAEYYKDINNYNYLDFSQAGKTTLSGQEAVFFEAPNGYCDGPACGYPFITYSTRHNGYYYNLVFYYDIEISAVENYILSTFRFLN